MDETLQARWKNGLPPFDGWTMHGFDSDVALDQMTAIVLAILSFLEEKVAVRNVVYVNEDWHEHDGVVMASETVKFEELKRAISGGSGRWMGPGDDLVYWGLYDEGWQYYFRFRLQDNCAVGSEYGEENHLDLTVAEENALEIRKLLLDRFSLDGSLVHAKEHFDRIWAGPPR